MTNLIEHSLALGDIPQSAKQPSEHRLEEEALSRMDDEGGSNNPAVIPQDAARKADPGNRSVLSKLQNVAALINPTNTQKGGS